MIDGFYSKLFTVMPGCVQPGKGGRERMIMKSARADHFHSSGVSVVAMPGAAHKAPGGRHGSLLHIPVANPTVHSFRMRCHALYVLPTIHMLCVAWDNNMN